MGVLPYTPFKWTNLFLTVVTEGGRHVISIINLGLIKDLGYRVKKQTGEARLFLSSVAIQRGFNASIVFLLVRLAIMNHCSTVHLYVSLH